MVCRNCNKLWRHNGILRGLEAAARLANLNTSRVVLGMCRQPGETSKKQPDLCIYDFHNAGQPTLVDVTATDPTALSHYNTLYELIGSAAGAKERRKNAKASPHDSRPGRSAIEIARSAASTRSPCKRRSTSSSLEYADPLRQRVWFLLAQTRSERSTAIHAGAALHRETTSRSRKYRATCEMRSSERPLRCARDDGVDSTRVSIHDRGGGLASRSLHDSKSLR